MSKQLRVTQEMPKQQTWGSSVRPTEMEHEKELCCQPSEKLQAQRLHVLTSLVVQTVTRGSGKTSLTFVQGAPEI